MAFESLPGTTRGEVVRYVVSLSTELAAMGVRRSRKALPQAQPWFCVTRKNLFQGRYLHDEQKLVSVAQVQNNALRHFVASRDGNLQIQFSES